MRIVVARYNENVEWTKQFSNVVIYNKGSPLENGYNEIMLDNVGREGHTYYKYICDNYDNLEMFTIFLQGNPFDHSPNIIRNIETHIQNTQHDFTFLSEYVINSTFVRERNLNWQCKDIYNTFYKIFNTSCLDKDCIFGAGAQFIVSKNKILQRPKEFYETIFKLLEYSVDPPEGHDIERMHKYIFSL